MTPFYRQDGITIYCEDSCKWLPPVDERTIMVTDPPYGTENGVGYGRQQNYVGGGRKINGDSTTDALFTMIGMLSVRIVQGIMFLSPRNHHQVETGLEAYNWFIDGRLIWDKVTPGLGQPVQYQHEDIVMLSRSNPSWVSTRSVLRYPLEERNNGKDRHPHQKPLPLMTYLMGLFPKVHVLDPFMGSGTTLVAAKLRGLKATGIDNDEEWCKFAVERLRQGVLLAV